MAKYKSVKPMMASAGMIIYALGHRNNGCTMTLLPRDMALDVNRCHVLVEARNGKARRG